MGVRVLHGSSSERPPTKGCNDVAVDGLGQACCFLAAFGLPFALRGSSGEAITDEAWGLGPGGGGVLGGTQLGAASSN
jgi:hypothetical protein